MRHQIGTTLSTVRGFYDDDKAELTLYTSAKRTIWSEDEVDNMLRVLEYATDPLEDLTELFHDAERIPSKDAYRAAELIKTHAVKLAELVYGTTP